MRTADEAAETRRDVDEIHIAEAAAAAVDLSRDIDTPRLTKPATPRASSASPASPIATRRMRTGIDLLVAPRQLPARRRPR